MADTRGAILIVDDDPGTAGLLGEFLSGRKLAVTQVQTLDEALVALERERPDSVLLSMRLGETDGLEALKRIRQVNVEVGVLVMAEEADAARAKEALDLGAKDCLTKPIDLDLLGAALDKLVAAAAPGFGFAEPAAASASASQDLLYSLALEIFRATRPLGPEARGSIGTALEQAALQAIQRGVSGEKAEVIRALNQVRTLVRFAHDLGDISAETVEQLDVPMTKARRSVGLT